MSRREVGRSGGIRTHDLRIKSPLPYPDLATDLKIVLADEMGFEPITSALTERHSTLELLAKNSSLPKKAGKHR